MIIITTSMTNHRETSKPLHRQLLTQNTYPNTHILYILKT